MRHCRSNAAIVGFVLAIGSVTAKAVPIDGQLFEFATNNHLYAWIDNRLTWSQANAAAQAFSTVHNAVLLEDWHLATITGQEENDFLAQTVLGLPGAFIGQFGDDRAWIGLFNENGPNNFEWVTGESTSFTNWHPAEPNNPAETVGTLGRYPDGTWNDEFDVEGNLGFGNRPYLIEHGLLITSVPEPSTLMLMAIGLAGVGWMGRRRKKV